MFKTLRPLILASESPRRKSLLLSVGVEFEVHPSRIDESVWLGESAEPGKSPAEIAERWACLKANSISPLHPDSWILGADTIVVLDGRIFGKPSDSRRGRKDAQYAERQGARGNYGHVPHSARGKLRRSGSVTTRNRAAGA